MEQRNVNINFQNKISDLEEKSEKLFEMNSSMSVELKVKGAGQIVQQDQGGSISKEDAANAKLYLEITEAKAKLENLQKDYDMFKKSVKNQMQQQQQLSLNPGNEKREKLSSKDVLKGTSEEIDKFNNKILEIKEQIQLLKDKNLVTDFNIEGKIGRDEIERLNKLHQMEFEKIQLKVMEALNKVDQKIKALNSADQTNKGSFDKVELVRKPFYSHF